MCKFYGILLNEVLQMKQLKIYFTSDLHGYIYPTDYTDTIEKPIGLLNILVSL